MPGLGPLYVLSNKSVSNDSCVLQFFKASLPGPLGRVRKHNRHVVLTPKVYCSSFASSDVKYRRRARCARLRVCYWERNEDEDFVTIIQNGSAVVSWPFALIVCRQVRLTVAVSSNISDSVAAGNRGSYCRPKVSQ